MIHANNLPTTPTREYPAELAALLEARCHDPGHVLGRRRRERHDHVRVFIPGACTVNLLPPGNALGLPMQRVLDSDIFEWEGATHIIQGHYQLRWTTHDGLTHCSFDPYDFAPQLPQFDLHLFSEGRHWHAYRCLGAHPRVIDGIPGVLFAVWAPNAERVSVVGDWNNWDGRRHPMRVHAHHGVWELFIPGVTPDALYKFELRQRDSGMILVKADPYARSSELRPGTASRVAPLDEYAWGDQEWLQRRSAEGWLQRPLAVYEVHLGSWQCGPHGEFLNYREIAHRLVEYVTYMGFTHIELLPITEHPLDASWGYQTTGYYAPTRRHGSPDDFRYFVDHCHRHGIGIILDWVPGHFPKDAHGLARFDGTALYEHEDPRRGEHRDWGTLIFNYARNEVKNFLFSSALYWLEEFHLDGLRVDAVASILYLDYSREAGDWLPNIYGGNENLEAIDFLRQVNEVAHARHPGVMIIAEESTAWPMVSRPTWLGGLGFSMKWNMGWMHDTLLYMSKDPVYRHYHHDHLTFGLLYAFTENFVLPFSHDEVVHGKQSLLNKMPGDEWQRFANLRLLLAYMHTYPGKKLLFMGCEFGQGNEWQHHQALDWWVLQYPLHQGIQTLVRDLNHFYRENSALYRYEFDNRGFEWLDCHDATQSVLSYVRKDEHRIVVVVLNFTPIPRHAYRLGVPKPGWYRERLNSDSHYYGGVNIGNGPGVLACDIPWMGRAWSIEINLPPLAALVFTVE